jgi:protein-tyrosine phosphatase
MYQQILFICSGNYYRSRFAEIYFNHWAEVQNLAWRAFSRGFHPGSHNVGAISPFALAGLAERGIKHTTPREPQVLDLDDLSRANRIIALKEAEHRKLMQRDFPEWENRIEYWHIHDLDFAEPAEALVILEAKLKDLMKDLSNSDSSFYCSKI